MAPKSRAITLLDAFDQPLHDLPQVTGLGADTHTSSETTAQTDPPKFWTDRTIQPYQLLANLALANTTVRRVVTENYLPSNEPTFMVLAEADVVRAAALYFLHPVNMALTARHSDVTIECLAESTSRGSSAKIRPDILYRKNGRNFALLEYKIMGVVDRPQFIRARVAATALPNQVTEKRADAENQKFYTFFSINALKIIKQMANYSENDERGTQYVAMFNWDWLFLSIFNDDKEIIHGTLVSRNGIQKRRYRKALLGWLLEAYSNDGKSKLKAPDR